mmetsp:Transcript_67511/g.195448  ORF Transcript_67511/g.195448 Transcript_67511/m.195448 type:complete len:233 (-) Transcript_67511:120-818(-)
MPHYRVSIVGYECAWRTGHRPEGRGAGPRPRLLGATGRRYVIVEFSAVPGWLPPPASRGVHCGGDRDRGQQGSYYGDRLWYCWGLPFCAGRLVELTLLGRPPPTSWASRAPPGRVELPPVGCGGDVCAGYVAGAARSRGRSTPSAAGGSSSGRCSRYVGGARSGRGDACGDVCGEEESGRRGVRIRYADRSIGGVDRCFFHVGFWYRLVFLRFDRLVLARRAPLVAPVVLHP